MTTAEQPARRGMAGDASLKDPANAVPDDYFVDTRIDWRERTPMPALPRLAVKASRTMPSC